MAGDVTERVGSRLKGGRRQVRRRIAVRIDMTPLVDIAFLLLIFYMVSTVFSMPQAMEITLPPDEEIPMAADNLLIIRVDDQGQYWWSKGEVSEANVPQLLPATTAGSVPGDTLRALLVAQARENPKLATLLLIHPDADYTQMVDILDEIDLIERSWNAYSARRLGIEMRNLPRDQRFSFRYAIGDWEATDDKIIAFALERARKRGEL